ncbi:MAG: MBL fold metallo-hydrolase [Clostridia bacterium]|nr:MBL fold metallo-hydrolase [Clostridia bacterium]
MELFFSPLFSGSSGNCLYVGDQRSHILVDAGVSASRILTSLRRIGVDPKTLSALLVTHEHSDHIKGIGILSRKFDIPVYATSGTWLAMEDKIGSVSAENRRVIRPEEDFYIGDIDITAFPTPHDASEPVGFSFSLGEARFCVATDIGCVKDQWMEYVIGSDAVLLESNYDPNMLAAGPYPYALKQRIHSRRGHLSNDDAGKAAVRLVGSGTRFIILGHLSKENNFPELALQIVSGKLEEAGYIIGRDADLIVAPRDESAGLFSLRSGFETDT